MTSQSDDRMLIVMSLAAFKSLGSLGTEFKRDLLMLANEHGLQYSIVENPMLMYTRLYRNNSPVASMPPTTSAPPGPPYDDPQHVMACRTGVGVTDLEKAAEDAANFLTADSDKKALPIISGFGFFPGGSFARTFRNPPRCLTVDYTRVGEGRTSYSTCARALE